MRRNSAEPIQLVQHSDDSPAAPLAADTPPTLDLSTILMLVDGQNPQIQLARERIQEAYAQADRADALWLPSLRAGTNYNKHEGAIQDVAGKVFNTSRNSGYAGWGANAVGAGSPTVPGIAANFHVADAVFQPRIAAAQTGARTFAADAARNDLLRDTAVAYWELVRAEHQHAIALEILEQVRDLETLTESYAQTGQGLRADHERVATERALREADVLRADEAVRVSSAELARLLRADPSLLIITSESAVVPLKITSIDAPAGELVSLGLSHRPELGEHHQLVAEACERLRREQYAPLVPSVLLGMSYGAFGGGFGGNLTDTDERFDADIVAYWEVRNLGLGERAVRDEASSRVRQARLRQAALLDRVAKDVVTAHAQVQTRAKRLDVIRAGLPSAEQSYALNRERIQNAQGLPIEVLQSIQSLATLRREYLNAIVDHNIAQFQLWWAMGWSSDPVVP